MDAFIFFIFPLKKPITQHWILTVDQQCCFQDILSGFFFFFEQTKKPFKNKNKNKNVFICVKGGNLHLTTSATVRWQNTLLQILKINQFKIFNAFNLTDCETQLTHVLLFIHTVGKSFGFKPSMLYVRLRF